MATKRTKSKSWGSIQLLASGSYRAFYRVDGGEPVKGYRRTFFLDAWERYTPHLLTTSGREPEAL